MTKLTMGLKAIGTNCTIDQEVNKNSNWSKKGRKKGPTSKNKYQKWKNWKSLLLLTRLQVGKINA